MVSKTVFLHCHAACTWCLIVMVCLVGFPEARAMEPFGKQPGSIRLFDADNGSRISLKIGDRFEITLPSQPGTGYGWQVSDRLPPILVARGDKMIPGEGIPGGIENQVLTFEAVEAGTGRLVLDYVRPWEKDVVPAHTFTVTVTVFSP